MNIIVQTGGTKTWREFDISYDAEELEEYLDLGISETYNALLSGIYGGEPKFTVREIADKADISRTTFYYYYMDVYDIYEQTERDVFKDPERAVNELGFADEMDMFGDIFKNIEENPEIFKRYISPRLRRR